jgi:hypothetical protein
MLYDPKWESPTETLDVWRKILLGAADLIDKKGWIQGAFERSTGFCIIGAMTRAATDLGLSDTRSHFFTFSQSMVVRNTDFETAHEHVFVELGNLSPMGWNDTVAKSKKEVVNLLLKVAGRKAPEQIVVDSSSWTGR